MTRISLHSFKEFLGDLSNEPKLLSKEFTWSLICAYDLSDSRHSVGRRKSLVSIAAAIAVVAGAFACHSGIRPNKRTLSQMSYHQKFQDYSKTKEEGVRL